MSITQLMVLAAHQISWDGLGAELTEGASQQVTYGGINGTLITITASSGTTSNTITFR